MVLLPLLFVTFSFVTISCCLNIDKEEGTYYLVKIPGWLLGQLIEERKDDVEVVETEEGELERSSQESSEDTRLEASKSKEPYNSTSRSENEGNSVSLKSSSQESRSDDYSTNKPQITKEEKKVYHKNDLQEVSQASSSRESERKSEKPDNDDRDRQPSENTDVQLHSSAEKKNMYFSYGNVYAPLVFEFGYRQGDKGHFTERREARKGPSSRIAVKWGDSKSGYGEHYWDLHHGTKQEKKA